MRSIAFFLLCVLAPVAAKGYLLKGVEYPETINLAGRTLRLVGVGLRQATIFKVDVYTLGAYVENRTCDLKKVVQSDEVKLLRLHFVRDVSAKTMRENMQKSFEKRTPPDASEELRRRIRAFIEIFDAKLEEGTEVELLYVPGQGTTVLVNGKKRGSTVPGHDFIQILWDIYFNENTCCPSLRKGVLESCQGMR